MSYYHIESILGVVGGEFPEEIIKIRYLVDAMLEHTYLHDKNGDYAPVFGKEGTGLCIKVYEYVSSPSLDVSTMSELELRNDLLDILMPEFENLFTDESGALIAISKYTQDQSAKEAILTYFEPYLSNLCGSLTNTEIVAEENISTVKEEEPPRKYFNSDKWGRRRPSGDFFMVDMVSPGQEGVNPKRVNLTGPNGQEISSLQLNVSPNTLNVSAAKKIGRVQTFTRWVEEHWGDELDQISFSGSTFAFIDFRGAGLCVESRDLTDPYKELQYLVNIYKMNGCTFQDESLGKNVIPREFFNYRDPANPYLVRRHPRLGFIKSRAHIKLRCDFLEAVGYFESFDVVESANSPFNMTFSVSFRSEHTRWL